MNENSSLAELQSFLDRCYGPVNLRNYSKLDLALKIALYASYAMKRIRQGRMETVGLNLALALAWAIALANRLKIVLDSPHSGEIWYRYPGVCPYCGGRPCDCKIRATARKEIPLSIRRRKAGDCHTIADLQQMFQEIYPGNTSASECSHLYEELIEVQEAVHLHDSTHRRKMFNHVKEELIDVIAHMFGVANTNGISLAREIAKLFPTNRCFKCNKTVCKCGFTQSTPILLRT